MVRDVDRAPGRRRRSARRPGDARPPRRCSMRTRATCACPLARGGDDDGACLIEPAVALQSLRLLPVVRTLTIAEFGQLIRTYSMHILVTRKLPSSVLAKLERRRGRRSVHRRGRDSRRRTARARGRQGRARLSAHRRHRPGRHRRRRRRSRSSPTSPSATTTSTCPYARSRGVVVTNTPDVLTESVADFTWALILAITRRLSEGERLVRRGELEGMGVRLHARHRAARQAARPRRRRAHRPRRGRARAGAFGDARRLHVASERPGRMDSGAGEHMSLDRLLDDLRHRLAARAADAGDAAPDRQARARADEAVRVPDQHVARAGRRRGGARLGARAAPARRRGARRLRERAGRASRPAAARERAARAAPRQRRPPKRERRWPTWRSTTSLAVLAGVRR